jgi:hypothetical protein
MRDVQITSLSAFANAKNKKPKTTLGPGSLFYEPLPFSSYSRAQGLRVIALLFLWIALAFEEHKLKIQSKI